MRGLILSTLVAGTAALTSLPAGAAGLEPLLDTGTVTAPTLVRDGCGPGFHRGFYGGCRPNFYRGGYGYGYRPRYYGGYYGGGYGWRRHWGF